MVNRLISRAPNTMIQSIGKTPRGISALPRRHDARCMNAMPRRNTIVGKTYTHIYIISCGIDTI